MISNEASKYYIYIWLCKSAGWRSPRLKHLIEAARPQLCAMWLLILRKACKWLDISVRHQRCDWLDNCHLCPGFWPFTDWQIHWFMYWLQHIRNRLAKLEQALRNKDEPVNLEFVCPWKQNQKIGTFQNACLDKACRKPACHRLRTTQNWEPTAQCPAALWICTSGFKLVQFSAGLHGSLLTM